MSRAHSKTVVLTRDTEGNATWGAHLETLGFTVYSLPTIETITLKPTMEDKDTVDRLSEFDWITFTSTSTVRYFYGLLNQLNIQWPLAGPKVAAIGLRTASQLERMGVQTDFRPSQANSMTLSKELPFIHGKRILLPRTDIASDELAKRLTARGAIVITFPLYTTRVLDTPDLGLIQELQTGTVDFIVFASPSATNGFSLRVSNPGALRRAKLLPAIAIGPTTQKALRKAEFKHIYTSTVPSLEGIIETLEQLARQ